ncbi:MAG TPA: hypothetical protein VFT53_00965 [Candidatus Saccharimonadales bacterium]|nr:hypothetical protein [Candidatus Saccharimonadales bacterium]
MQSKRVLTVFGLIIGALVPLMNLTYPKVGAVLTAAGIIFCIPFLLAFGYSTWYIRRGKYNERWLALLFWSNVITWVIPVLGVFTAAATNLINMHNHGEDRRKYMRLASIGILLSVTHLVLKIAHIVRW